MHLIYISLTIDLKSNNDSALYPYSMNIIYIFRWMNMADIYGHNIWTWVSWEYSLSEYSLIEPMKADNLPKHYILSAEFPSSDCVMMMFYNLPYFLIPICHHLVFIIDEMPFDHVYGHIHDLYIARTWTNSICNSMDCWWLK